MPKTFQFLAPSLHPNTLTELAIPEAGPSAPEPIVRHLAIKYGAHQAVGSVKRMLQTGDDEVSSLTRMRGLNMS
jgi:ribosome biogenesis protein NSA1